MHEKGRCIWESLGRMDGDEIEGNECLVKTERTREMVVSRDMSKQTASFI